MRDREARSKRKRNALSGTEWGTILNEKTPASMPVSNTEYAIGHFIYRHPILAVVVVYLLGILVAGLT